MINQVKFIAALTAVFPTLSNTAAVKCWREASRLPEAALTALYHGLMQGGLAALELRQATALAITGSIGISR